jgi:hypothetical protein
MPNIAQVAGSGIDDDVTFPLTLKLTMAVFTLLPLSSM